VSLDYLGKNFSNHRAGILGSCLDAATGLLLERGKSPKRKVHQLDNRGSHFYLSMYWARELAEQKEDAELASLFAPVAEKLEAGRPPSSPSWMRPREPRSISAVITCPMRKRRRRSCGPADASTASLMVCWRCNPGRSNQLTPATRSGISSEGIADPSRM
jgi:hypothetical protein